MGPEGSRCGNCFALQQYGGFIPLRCGFSNKKTLWHRIAAGPGRRPAPAFGDLWGSIAPGFVVVWQVLSGDRVEARLAGVRVRRPMTKDEETELKTQLERLRQEHRDLDAAIEALQTVPGSDILRVQRLKKRKLVLRDRITFIEDQLTPDIIA
jgi:hypothetical protein